MVAAKTLIDETEVTQELGLVERAEPTLSVRTPGGLYRANRAASCLVRPEPSDRVLVAVAASGEAWVLAVLERASDRAVPLRFEGDVDLTSAGAVRVQGERGVELRSRERVGVVARLLDVKSGDLRAIAERFGVVGGAAQVELTNLKAVIDYVDQTFERLSARMKRCYRFVQELEMTRAREIDLRADNTVHVRSKNTFMNAKDLVKVEGDQIHLG